MNSSADCPAPRRLREVCASPEYFSGIASLLERMAPDGSAAELVLALRHATQRLGADVSYFASFVREDTEFDSFRFLIACDPVWSLQYEEQNCVAADPWLRYAQSHTEAALATEVTAISEREQQTVALAGKFGFRSAFIVPAPTGVGSRVGVLVLGSRAADFFDDEGRTALKVLARGIAMELHERFAEVMQRELISRCDLRAGELDLLRHHLRGQPTKVIASMLGCSAGAVDQRFHRLIAKLGVNNRGQAARLAAAYGLI